MDNPIANSPASCLAIAVPQPLPYLSLSGWWPPYSTQISKPRPAIFVLHQATFNVEFQPTIFSYDDDEKYTCKTPQAEPGGKQEPHLGRKISTKAI